MVGQAFEINFDGIVGPTHNYAGLSLGNVASMTSSARDSNPKEAALQGLRKMKHLADLGLKQGWLPPQERPDLATLRRLGFRGSDPEILAACAKLSPALLPQCYSASTMWTANAATVAPSADSTDRRVHFTPANLMNKLHRSLEGGATARALRCAFPDEDVFTIHEPLPRHEVFGDEGAANHTRLCQAPGSPGVHFFVYGKAFFPGQSSVPKIYPARQTLEASEAVARLHQLSPEAVVFAQQNPQVIDAGVFHNDVISVGNENVFFYHEKAFAEGTAPLKLLGKAFRSVSGVSLIAVEVPDAAVSVEAAVKSYLFNSQLVTLPNGRMALLAPIESQNNPEVANYLRGLVDDTTHPIDTVEYLDLRQSMNNGGGPACLRLRVCLTPAELAVVAPGFLYSEKAYHSLVAWVEKHYRDRLSAKDLADPLFLKETRTALDALTQLLGAGSLYPFQRASS